MKLRLRNGGNSVDPYYQLAWRQIFVLHHPTDAMTVFLETELFPRINLLLVDLLLIHYEPGKNSYWNWDHVVSETILSLFRKLLVKEKYVIEMSWSFLNSFIKVNCRNSKFARALVYNNPFSPAWHSKMWHGIWNGYWTEWLSPVY